MELKKLEEIENKYLNKYFFFLKFALDEILEGLSTREKIKNDWYDFYDSKINEFSTGAERVIYSILNGKGIGIPNSAPVGSDLFFEVTDAFIHIDLKTVSASLKSKGNIRDFAKSIFIGSNQNSYKEKIILNEGKPDQYSRQYTPHLPPIYNKNTKFSKPCLTYFITMLYDKDTLETLVINILCMPNGLLSSVYKNRPISAGKNKNEIRFNFSKTENFQLLNNQQRIKIVFFNPSMNSRYLSVLKWQNELFQRQSI